MLEGRITTESTISFTKKKRERKKEKVCEAYKGRSAFSLTWKEKKTSSKLYT
jgi:hypothetical protein